MERHAGGGYARARAAGVFMEKRRGDPCVEIWTTGMARMAVDIDRLRQGLDALEAQSPHER